MPVSIQQQLSAKRSSTRPTEKSHAPRELKPVRAATYPTNEPGAQQLQPAPLLSPLGILEQPISGRRPASPPPHTFQGGRASLPPMTTSPVSLRGQLGHYPAPAIIYNLLDHPQYVENGPSNIEDTKPSRWLDYTTTYPWPLSVMTISIPKVETPIVVTPSDGNFTVKIRDALVAVYRALRIEAYKYLCRGADKGRSLLWQDPNYKHPRQSEEDIKRVITKILRGRVFWGGLSLSETEHDVWNLHVR